MTTRLLHLGTSEESKDTESGFWIPKKLSGITAGMQVAWSQRTTTPDTIMELEIQCIKAKVDGVVLTNERFLERLLYAQPDFIPPSGTKKISLDDYQGSFLLTPREKIPVVVLNPLLNLRTVNHAEHAAKRFISKLATPSRWYNATRFTWQLAEPSSIQLVHDRMSARAALIGVDIETIIDDPLRRISCITFCAYYPDTHTTESIVIPFTDQFWYTWVQKFCDLPNAKVFQNGLYDNLYLLRWGCPVRNWLHDTQHLFHSMFSEYPKRLDFIAAYAIRNIRYWKDDGKTGNLEDYYRYNALDGWATVNSYLSLLRDAEPYAVRNYLDEFPLVFPCLNCEIEGVAVDQPVFDKVAKETEEEMLEQDKKFVQMIAAPGFNAGSWQQKLKLFHVLGLTKLSMEDLKKQPAEYTVLGGLKNTNKASMLKAKASSSFNERILTEMTDVIEDRKLLSTYLVKDKIWYGRIHYKINPAATDTGRLNSTASSYWTGFQIQNVPRGIRIKQFLRADSGWLLAEIDKAQAEARCVGYLAGEEKLINVVEGPHDYHAWNAQAFFGVPYETIYSDELHKTINSDVRDLSKRTNHGANYNMGAGVMLDTMGPKHVSKAKVILRLAGSLRDVCEFLLDRYAKTYPRVKGDWYDSITKEVQLTGRLISPDGHTRICFGKPWLNKRDLNAIVAHKPQHLSVALINREFYNLWRCQIYGECYKISWFDGSKQLVKLPILKNNVRLKAQIHDSLFFQYDKRFPTIPEIVRSDIMDSRIPVKGSDGITRTMFIPSDIAAGKTHWSQLK